MSEAAGRGDSRGGDDGWGAAFIFVLVMAVGGAGGWAFLNYKQKMETQAKAAAAAEAARAKSAAVKEEFEAALRKAKKEAEAARAAAMAQVAPVATEVVPEVLDTPFEEERRQIQANLSIASFALEAFTPRTPEEGVLRNKLFAEIAVAQSRGGAAKKAQQTLETAIDYFPNKLPPDEGASALLPLVQAFLVIEKQDDAWSLLAQIKRDSLRDSVLLELTEALLESGREAEARTALAQIRRPAERCRALLKIVIHEASHDAPLKDSGRELLALAQAALAQANLPAEELLRTDLLPSLAQALVFAGEYDQARRTAEPIASPLVKIDLLLHEARVRLARKDQAGAAAALVEAERRIAGVEEAERIVPWIEVAKLRRQAGPADAAAQALSKARDAVGRLQSGNLPAGQVDSAVPHVRAAALARIARQEQLLGSAAPSRQDLLAAFQEVEGIPEAEERAAARLDVGEAQIDDDSAPEAGHAAARQALDAFAKEVEAVAPPAAQAELWVRAVQLAAAAEHPRRGDWLEKARLASGEVPLSGERGRLLRTLLAEMVRQGDVSRAQSLAEKEKAELSKAQALIGVGEGRLDLWESTAPPESAGKRGVRP